MGAPVCFLVPVVPQMPVFVFLPGDLLADLGESFFLGTEEHVFLLYAARDLH